MGTADIVPGVSGGTIALITGIYERLVHAISSVDLRFISHFIKRDFDGAQNFEASTYAFFFGLILASAVLLYPKIEGLSIKILLFSVAGFLVATLQIGHSLPIIFLSGMIAICAMILPGISGAFILLLLNQYEYMLSVLKDLQFLEIFIFIIGALIGILAFSRVLDRVLRKYKSFTLAFLIGLMLGTLRLLYENIESSIDSIWPVVISGLLGFFIILVLIELRKRVVVSRKV